MRLNNLQINGLKVNLSNLVIIVGPNGSGKTRFLQDLYAQFINSTPTAQFSDAATKWPHLLTEDFLSAGKVEWEEWVDTLKPIQGAPTSNPSEKVYAISGYLSHDERSSFILESTLNNLRNALSRHEALGDLHGLYGTAFKGQYTELLRVERRLYISQNSSATLNTRYSVELRPATFLAVNTDTLNRINRILGRLFGKEIYVLSHNSPQYSIDVVKMGTPKPKNLIATTQNLLKQKEIYTEWHHANSVISPGDEGHGVRAALEILYNLENPSKKVLFIDEPELHLYPSAKYQIGQAVAEYAASDGKQVILATHDTDFLAGLIRGHKDATILRINTDRSIKVFSSGPVNKAYGGDILQSAFQDVAIIVEGISDEFVYRNIIGLRKLLAGVSYQVIPSHGADRAGEALPFAQELGITAAVILDFDTLFKSSKKKGNYVSNILAAMKVEASKISSAKTLIDEISIFPNRDDLSRNGLKASGLSTTQQKKINELLEILKDGGLFVVQFGGVEQWVNLPIHASPEAVFRRYANRPSQFKELNKFLEEVSEYLRKNL